MENMQIYETLKKPPKEALKKIEGGRLSGMSSINPMWRIKALTERFGPCGIGWKYTIDRQWLETGANDEIKAFVQISLYIKVEDAWSDPIPGIGGNSFVAKEKNGLHTSDECYKMALTDALSIACKSLGMAGDIYWQEDDSKYSRPKTDLAYHDILAIQQRINERMTTLIQRGMDEKDIFAYASTSKKTFDRSMLACQWLHDFERTIAKL